MDVYAVAALGLHALLNKNVILSPPRRTKDNSRKK